MTEKELIVMNKLEYLKEIRYRMQECDRLRSSINEELDLVNVEEKCLQEYRREMDSLYQEKMTHVEELRQIHSDINMLENVLKQSEEDRNRHVDNVKRLHHHLQQIKDGVEKMRSEIGLPRLNENNQLNSNNQNQKDEDSLMLDRLDLVLDSAAKRNQSSSYLKGEFELKSTTMDPLVAKQLSSSSNTSTTKNIAAASSVSSSSSASNIVAGNKPFADNTNTSGHKSTGQTYSSSLASLMSGF
ncbi:zinc finger C4H2 domain-containing protein-like protein, partial [Euroglyphus maynei]